MKTLDKHFSITVFTLALSIAAIGTTYAKDLTVNSIPAKFQGYWRMIKPPANPMDFADLSVYPDSIVSDDIGDAAYKTLKITVNDKGDTVKVNYRMMGKTHMDTLELHGKLLYFKSGKTYGPFIKAKP